MSATKSEVKVENWIKNLQNGNIKTRTLQIIKFIKENPKCSLETIRDKTGLPHQTVTGCISNVMDEGLVKFVGKTESDKGIYSLYEYVTDMAEMYALKEQRNKEKMKHWAKYGLDRFYSLLSPETQNCLIGITNLNTISDKDAIEEEKPL
jgi:transcription initiation factor IIE alpha subunit